MSKKARVTADEKRVRALEFFMEEKTLFNLKELESKLSKEKGIVSQAVKDLIDELVNDNLIEKDKIGSGNYFWCFPSKGVTAREGKVTALENTLKTMQDSVTELTDRKRKLMETRQDTPERTKAIADLAEQERRKAKLDDELKKYAASDPEKMKQLEKAVKVCRDSANRWTDNIHVMLSFYKGKMAEYNEEELLKHFQLPVDLDELPA